MFILPEPNQHPMENVPVHTEGDAPRMGEIARQITAFVPVYCQGNRTLVLLSEGRMFYLPHRAQWVRETLLRHFAISQRDLRRACEEDLNRSLFAPVVIPAEGLAYAQLRVRTPIGRNDGAQGFFRIDAIQGIRAINPEETAVRMSDGIEFMVRMPRPRVVERVLAARSALILQRARGVAYPRF
ncbi:hypothetical protein Aaci_0267 [Alicyclobacillus acidocaldarius subsp. acidocaldarius DSM 446]|uniref:ComK family protein n=1 Tax=Alicyclobacillus acidocaldarius subsp. acidocaldarius (strain ATCC 27009 / DSM 446 / BCRC 14685 / JCM 5260 / KCTC 1825 / NBRC 15652 / NCIMB 11725 / NRRL B-14509 / 104-IA) TaxID=521098 RepID=C8WRC4_ALIAD|nr:hypothetical protein Aaci_0267 [Alicyclobacillus acidocaldarius subsp. acidocaldarius DSM 446]